MYSDYMPAPMRNPFIYVPHGVLPPTSTAGNILGEAGQRRAEAGIIRPTTAPVVPAHAKKANPYPVPLPARTALTPDRLFDAGICFPRGDMGPQMFPRFSLDKPKFDGDSWAKKTRSVFVKEVGSKPHNGLRSFSGPRTGGSILYQMSVPPPLHGV